MYVYFLAVFHVFSMQNCCIKCHLINTDLPDRAPRELNDDDQFAAEEDGAADVALLDTPVICRRDLALQLPDSMPLAPQVVADDTSCLLLMRDNPDFNEKSVSVVVFAALTSNELVDVTGSEGINN